MLIITIDLVPSGIAPMRRTIASMRIANVGDAADVSDYRVEALESANPLIGTRPRSAYGVVAGHDRRQSVWALLSRASETILQAEHDEF